MNVRGSPMIGTHASSSDHSPQRWKRSLAAAMVAGAKRKPATILEAAGVEAEPPVERGARDVADRGGDEQRGGRREAGLDLGDQHRFRGQDEQRRRTECRGEHDQQRP